jgi:hypothetical protein
MSADLTTKYDLLVKELNNIRNGMENVNLIGILLRPATLP